MNEPNLVFGLLDLRGEIADSEVADKYRDLTIAWSRYDYSGRIIEGRSFDEILEEASRQDERYCFIQSCGHIVSERWDLKPTGSPDFLTALGRWSAENDFLVVGQPRFEDGRWWGLQRGCLLVDLERYRSLDCPAADPTLDGPIELPRVIVDEECDALIRLASGTDKEVARPSLPGWNLIASSLNVGLAVPRLPMLLRHHTVSLEPEVPTRVHAFARVLDRGLSAESLDAERDLSSSQRSFLESLQRQATSARSGVFLWNIEAYTDVEEPGADWTGPTSSLYSVAAGFKPNRILESHGYSDDTRVVFFDYSARALEIRAEIVQRWDGYDYPDFVRHLFARYPHPETFYQLWSDVTPATVQDEDLDRMWQSELDRWGGAERFGEHWQRYAKLRHEYVHCDLLGQPEPLLEKIDAERNAVIWFSNAFFTMNSNWHYDIDERRSRYERWVANVVDANPGLLLYGSDYNNINVNCLEASDYWASYQDSGGDPLSPAKLYHHELRM